MFRLTYSDYLSMGGTEIPPSNYDRLYRQVMAYIKSHTFGRLECSGISIEVFQNCIFDLLELYMIYEKQGIKSEELGEYSVTYDFSQLQIQKRKLLNIYLGESGILYRGV